MYNNKTCPEYYLSTNQEFLCNKGKDRKSTYFINKRLILLEKNIPSTDSLIKFAKSNWLTNIQDLQCLLWLITLYTSFYYMLSSWNVCFYSNSIYLLFNSNQKLWTQLIYIINFNSSLFLQILIYSQVFSHTICSVVNSFLKIMIYTCCSI